MEYVKVIFQSVYNPVSFLENPKGKLIVNKYGWIFIVTRWLCCSIIFYFRDYHGNWKPFISPPFGIDLDTYAFLQIHFSLLFGMFLMGAITLFLSWYLHSIEKEPSSFKIFNILGVTFFLPFIIVQSIDMVVISTIGWRGFIVTPIHTLILLWESIVATDILSYIYDLSKVEKVYSIILIIVVWLVISGILWR